MTQRRGERTAVQNERDFPYIVELPVPPNGFGAKLDSMYEFHREHGIQDARGRGQRRNEGDFVRWCFGKLDDAKEFSKAFGGELLAA